jgi:hypothetical protein
MKRLLLLLAGAVVLGACSGNGSQPTTQPSSGATTPPDTTTVTAKPQPVQIARWWQEGTLLSVELTNPNTDVGLSRAGFQIATIAADGSIIETLGSEGLPGALCCTIYHLPPRGTYGLQLLAAKEKITKLELTLKAGGFQSGAAEWLEWATVKPATATAGNLRLRWEDYGAGGPRAAPTVTGRVTLSGQPGPSNVAITAWLEQAGARRFVILTGTADCVLADQPKAFSLTAADELPRTMRLAKVVVVPTQPEARSEGC